MEKFQGYPLAKPFKFPIQLHTGVFLAVDLTCLLCGRAWSTRPHSYLVEFQSCQTRSPRPPGALIEDPLWAWGPWLHRGLWGDSTGDWKVSTALPTTAGSGWRSLIVTAWASKNWRCANDPWEITNCRYLEQQHTEGLAFEVDDRDPGWPSVVQFHFQNPFRLAFEILLSGPNCAGRKRESSQIV